MFYNDFENKKKQRTLSTVECEQDMRWKILKS